MLMDYTKNKIVMDHFRAGINLFLTFQLRSSAAQASAGYFCKGQIQNILDLVDPNVTVTETQYKSTRNGNEHIWLCFNETLFIKTGIKLICFMTTICQSLFWIVF